MLFSTIWIGIFPAKAGGIFCEILRNGISRAAKEWRLYIAKRQYCPIGWAF